jgi:hypothetical protein
MMRAQQLHREESAMEQPKIPPRELVQRMIDGRGYRFQDLIDYKKDDFSEAIRLLNHIQERIKLEQKLLSQEHDRLRGTVSATV